MATFGQSSFLPFVKTIIVLFFFITNTLQAQQAYVATNDYYNYETIPTYTEDDIKARLSNMKLCIPAKYSSVVKSYVKTYMVNSRDKARAIVGRTVMFFPIFEKYIAEKGLPKDLKFVSVLESALRPDAVSRSNAVGLWQFMEPTAKDYNLRVNSTVDERRDPHRSTEAALRYLQRLHNKYGDWALALAAYNGGPGRVNRAIKRGRSKNYWRISKYLPKETRNYVPAFFAAAYLMNYYHEHGIIGTYPDLDMQITDFVKVYQTISFDEISNITGIPAYTIETLNPSYKKKIIPASPRGNYLILPQRVMGSFMQYLKYPDTRNSTVYSSSNIRVNTHPNENFFQTKYVVRENDNIHSLAKVFKCNTYNIRAWNHLISDYIHPGQELTMYQPFVTSDYQPQSSPNLVSQPVVRVSKPQPQLRKYNTETIASLPLEKIDARKKKKKEVRTLATLSHEAYLYYSIIRGESLEKVADKYPGVTLEDILKLNDFSERKKNLKPGTRIRIKRM